MNTQTIRRLRMGQVGGGPGAFIGRIHRMAAGLDGEIELVCGAFSSHPEQSKIAGASLYLDPQRAYASYVEMIETEKELPADRRMDFVSCQRNWRRHQHDQVSKAHGLCKLDLLRKKALRVSVVTRCPEQTALALKPVGSQ